MSGNAVFLETVVTAIVSSGLLWGSVQWILQRKQRKNEEIRKRHEHERALIEDRLKRERAEDERRELLAEAQATAQRTALDSAKERFDLLAQDYRNCRDDLIALREATWMLISAFEGLLVRANPADDGESYIARMQLSELGEARRAINDARRHLR